MAGTSAPTNAPSTTSVYSPTTVDSHNTSSTVVNNTGVDPQTLDTALATIGQQSNDITQLAQGDQALAASLGNSLSSAVSLLGAAMVGGFSSMTQSLNGMFANQSGDTGSSASAQSLADVS